MEYNVYVVCGVGASSGFIAKAIRSAASKRGIAMKVKAASQSTMEDFFDEADAIMIGPHFAHLVEEAKELTAEGGPAVFLMRQDYFKKLDGDAALDHLLDELRKVGKYE